MYKVERLIWTHAWAMVGTSRQGTDYLGSNQTFKVILTKIFKKLKPIFSKLLYLDEGDKKPNEFSIKNDHSTLSNLILSQECKDGLIHANQ